MGAINYFTSDYITLGVKPYDKKDLVSDPDFIQFITENWGVDVNNEYQLMDAIQEEIDCYYECDHDNIKAELEKYSFWYYHVSIKLGYYEGFTIDIENNFPVAYDDYTDRREANKEITMLKQFLISCVNYGLVCVLPGWSTAYYNREETLNEINIVIRKMREEVRTIPTWRQYEHDAN